MNPWVGIYQFNHFSWQLVFCRSSHLSRMENFILGVWVIYYARVISCIVKYCWFMYFQCLLVEKIFFSLFFFSFPIFHMIACNYHVYWSYFSTLCQNYFRSSFMSLLLFQFISGTFLTAGSRIWTLPYIMELCWGTAFVIRVLQGILWELGFYWDLWTAVDHFLGERACFFRKHCCTTLVIRVTQRQNYLPL